jgi:transposase
MELLTLTVTELSRLQVAQQVLDRVLSVAQAAELLHLSSRQIKRLTRRLRQQGAAAFGSVRRGRPPNNAIDPLVRERAVELAGSTYRGFGPTLLSEKLAERDDIIVNRETLRQWLIEEKLHRPRRRRRKARPLRERRSRFGELIQADGSPHRWFEERGNPCTLMLCVDDATTFVLGGLFAPAETTDGYFELFENIFVQYGLPLACYTDRHSIFRMNQAGARIDEETQVQRALRELDVQLICANSPQAKGRVERINRTFQDRLVKEFRLAGVATISQANAELPKFLETYNARFAVLPRDAENAHRPSDPVLLHAILSKSYDRALTANLTFQLGDQVFAIDPPALNRFRAGVRVTVQVPRGENPIVLHRGAVLPARLVGNRQRAAAIVNSKDLNATVDQACGQRKAFIPSKSHPWKKGYDPILLTKALE